MFNGPVCYLLPLACYHNILTYRLFLLNPPFSPTLRSRLGCLHGRWYATLLIRSLTFWSRLTFSGSPRQSHHKQASNATSIYNCFCQLTETISGTMYTLYSPVSTITGEVLLNIYTLYLDWYDQMPDALRLGLNSTPSVLVSQ